MSLRFIIPLCLSLGVLIVTLIVLPSLCHSRSIVETSMSLHWDFAPRLVVLRLVLEASCYHLSTVVRSKQTKYRFAPTCIDHLIRLSTASHLGQGFEVVASIRQLLKGPVSENHDESLATFITSESEDTKVEEAGAEYAKCQERSNPVL